jgi:hypothetical protein
MNFVPKGGFPPITMTPINVGDADITTKGFSSVDDIASISSILLAIQQKKKDAEEMVTDNELSDG